MSLTQLFGSHIVQAIRTQGSLTIQATGDTGVDSQDQRDVAIAMSRDLDPNHRQKGPLFFLNLGDVIYGTGKKERYANHFYRPNLEYIQAPLTYDAAILAIPGNHDGEVRSPSDSPSLSAFWENFCQPTGSNAPMAQSFGVTMPDQPGAYWWLDTPFLDLIGLYSNSKENDGMLGADDTKMHQRIWLRHTLTTIGAHRQNNPRKALVIAVHHPPYARGLNAVGHGHPGSPILLAQMDEACRAADVWPDVVISGHAHNYQRYMRYLDLGGKNVVIPYFVVGTGGIDLQDVPPGIGINSSGADPDRVVYVNALKEFGYARITADAASVSTTFVRTQGNHRDIFETVQIDLASGQQIHPQV
jgi:predicted phosphodiesterase